MFFNSINQYKNERISLDQEIMSFSEEIEDKNINYSTQDLKNGKCVQLKPIMHMFNHQTHHRGQISNILDDLSITNDYSNMINL